MPDQVEWPAFPTRGARSPPQAGGRDTVLVVHADAAAQELGRAPWRQDVRRWAVPAIGAGLGDASSTYSAEDRR